MAVHKDRSRELARSKELVPVHSKVLGLARSKVLELELVHSRSQLLELVRSILVQELARSRLVQERKQVLAHMQGRTMACIA